MENTMFFPIKKHILNESSVSEVEKGEDKNQPKPHHVSESQWNDFGFAIR